MVNDYKEVRFDLYCKKCKNMDLGENEEPCNSCLTEYTNYNSIKPVHYTEKSKYPYGKRNNRNGEGR